MEDKLFNTKVKLTGDIIHFENEDVKVGMGTILCQAPGSLYEASYSHWKKRAEKIVKLWNESVDEKA